jgi:hypothetical protein
MSKSKSKSIFSVTISYTENELEYILDILNEHELEENEKKLTVKEVVKNKKLLSYIFSEDFVKFSGDDSDDYWNNDGWSEWRNYR